MRPMNTNILAVRFYYLGLILLLNTSCTNKDETNSTVLESNVLKCIFPELIKETFFDFRKLPIPLPLPENASKETIDTMQNQSKKFIEEYKTQLDTTKFAPLYVIVEDSVFPLSKSNLSELNRNNKNLHFIDSLDHKKPYRIDLSKLKLDNQYILKYKSDFSTGIKELRTKDRKKHKENHLMQYSGIIYLSRIYFNKTEDYGFFIVVFNCGKLCGFTYDVYVKKEGGKWIIDKIESNTVS